MAAADAPAYTISPELITGIPPVVHPPQFVPYHKLVGQIRSLERNAASHEDSAWVESALQRSLPDTDSQLPRILAKLYEWGYSTHQRRLDLLHSMMVNGAPTSARCLDALFGFKSGNFVVNFHNEGYPVFGGNKFLVAELAVIVRLGESLPEDDVVKVVCQAHSDHLQVSHLCRHDIHCVNPTHVLYESAAAQEARQVCAGTKVLAVTAGGAEGGVIIDRCPHTPGCITDLHVVPTEATRSWSPELATSDLVDWATSLTKHMAPCRAVGLIKLLAMAMPSGKGVTSFSNTVDRLLCNPSHFESPHWPCIEDGNHPVSVKGEIPDLDLTCGNKRCTNIFHMTSDLSQCRFTWQLCRQTPWVVVDDVLHVICPHLGTGPFFMPCIPRDGKVKHITANVYKVKSVEDGKDQREIKFAWMYKPE